MKIAEKLFGKFRKVLSTGKFRAKLDSCDAAFHRNADIINSCCPEVGIAFKELQVESERLLSVLTTDSTNSSLPPSQDPFRSKNGDKTGSTASEKTSTTQTESSSPSTDKKRKPGGQPGHKGHTLERLKPTQVVHLPVPKNKLTGTGWKQKAPIVRQKQDITMSVEVTDYEAEVWENEETGERIVAEFPPGIEAPVQYGNNLRQTALELSIRHMEPYERLVQFIESNYGLKISVGTIRNFIKSAVNLLISLKFFIWLKMSILDSSVVHFDETGINVDGSNEWVLTASTSSYTYLYASDYRGTNAIEEMGILPHFEGTAVTDCFSAYLQYTNCKHALCCAHLERDLNKVIDLENVKWAMNMKKLLREILKAKEKYDGNIPEKLQEKFLSRYKSILTKADSEEADWKEKHRSYAFNSKVGDELSGDTEEGSRTKGEILIDRLRNRMTEYLSFMVNYEVPYTNNNAEQSLRMLKVRQKISGTFKNFATTNDFCGMSSYIDTCRKHGLSVSECLKILLEGRLPDFIDISKIRPEFLQKEKPPS